VSFLTPREHRHDRSSRCLPGLRPPRARQRRPLPVLLVDARRRRPRDGPEAGAERAPRSRGAGTLAVACGGSVGQGAGEKDGGRADHETHESGFGDELIATLYGVAFDAGLPPDDGGKPDVGFAPPYGIAPMFDAGQGDAGQATDATLGEDVMIGADYGAPPNHG